MKIVSDFLGGLRDDDVVYEQILMGERWWWLGGIGKH